MADHDGVEEPADEFLLLVGLHRCDEDPDTLHANAVVHEWHPAMPTVLRQIADDLERHQKVRTASLN